MGKKVKKKEFELAPEGTHPAIITAIADLGEQLSNWEGKERHVYKWGVGFELSGPETTAGTPFSIATTVTDSLHSKSRLYPIVKAARGTVADELDMEDLVGKKVLVTVEHDEKDEKTWANVEQVTGLPTGMDVADTETPLLYFDLDTPDAGIYEKLPALFKKRIEERVQQAAVPGFDDDVPC